MGAHITDIHELRRTWSLNCLIAMLWILRRVSHPFSSLTRALTTSKCSRSRGKQSLDLPSGVTLDELKRTVMSLTRVIVKEEESAAVVDYMLRRREPVAVDMEGIATTPTGLVQVRIRDGPIYLFRPGYNPRLLHEGRLKDLLQSADVLKVMHASTTDCIGIGADGVKMWGLYDTALAENVVQHQNGVENVQFGAFTSYNNLCAKYGLVVNPLKHKYFGNSTYQEESIFQESEVIPEDLVFYSACDVYALHDLYDAVDSQIDPDFRPILNDLCEMELI